jgi:hypothetical protein
MNALETA